MVTCGGIALENLFQNDENNFNNKDENEPKLFQNSPYYNQNDFNLFLNSSKSKFTIISLNCQSLNSKFDMIKTYLDIYNSNNNKISIVCLQETWLTEDSDLSLYQIPEYNLISMGKYCSEHGGLAIYIHKKYNFRQIDLEMVSEVWEGQCIEIFEDKKIKNHNIKNNKIIICNIYRPPRQSIENITNFRTEITETIQKLKNCKNVILTGDFNVNLLKYHENNSTNEFLENIISQGYIPKITQPTRLCHTTGTLIDNFFVKISDHFSKFKSGILLNAISDHLPIFTSIDYFENNTKNTHTNQYIEIHLNNENALINFKNDLQSSDIIQELTSIFEQKEDINKQYDKFHKLMVSLTHKHFSSKIVKYNKYKHKKSKWITTGILKSIQYRDKLYAKLKHTNTNDIYYSTYSQNFKTYNKILKKALRHAKALYYQNQFEYFRTDMKKTWSTINEILNRNKNKQTFPDYFVVNDSQIKNKETIANEFNEYFINAGQNLAKEITIPHNKSFRDYLQIPIENNFMFEPVTIETVIKVIESLKDTSSKGIDNLNNRILKYVKYDISWIITKFVNIMFTENRFPNWLKIAKVVPIYKKDDCHYFQNYRPISILSSVSKIFEKIIHNQLFAYFTSSNIFNKYQYGFRSKHSTELATLHLVDQLILNMDNNKLPLNIYMDLSKAFDTLDHNILIEKLQHYGIRNQSLELLKDYLNNRYQYVNYQNVDSNQKAIKHGVPQGSILGPLLFIIYLNDLENVTINFTPLLYADDITLITNIDIESKLNIERLNAELGSISDWLKLNKLSLNIKKTKAMLFHSPQKLLKYPKLSINGKDIEFVKNFSFLGIQIDENLKWNFHIDFIMKKLARILGIMTKLKYDIPTQALLNIYNALVLPHLTYGIMVWGHKHDKILPLQKRAIRIITKSHYKSHTSILFKNVNVLRINDLFSLHSYKFSYQLENALLPYYFSFEMTDALIKPSHGYNTRNFNLLNQPKINHEFARHCITNRYPDIFNNMPLKYKEKIYTHSFNSFKYYIKNTIIQNYEENCQINKCYICELY